jgi:hypothetical protein
MSLRDFVLLFSTAYLVDNALAWLIVALFSAWYLHGLTGVAGLEWGGFVSQATAAFLGAYVARILQGRDVGVLGRWLWDSVDDAFGVAQAGIAVLCGFVATLGYTDVIELTGSPSSAQVLCVGRVRSIAGISLVLVCASLALTLLRKVALVRRADVNFFEPRWYMTLNALLVAVILAELAFVQAWAHTWPLYALMAAMLAANALGNI